MRAAAARTALIAAALVIAAPLATHGGAVASAPSTAAPQRTGTTAAGVRFVLTGRTLRITVPATTKRGRTIAVRCGRQTTADLRGLSSYSPAVMAKGSRVFRGRRRMQIRLNRDVAAIAEWCDFDTKPSGRSGAAELEPQIAPPPAHLVAGPGVREGRTEEPGGLFLVDGSRLTLRAQRPLPPDRLVFLACYAGDAEGLRTIGARTLAVGTGRHLLSADLGAGLDSATACLAEDHSSGGSDLYLTYFGAS